MSILIPGALPDSPIAPALAAELERTAPELVTLFRRCHAQNFALPPSETGCTPDEVWHLQSTGFVPTEGDNWASGLGPLLHPDAPAAQPVWLLECSHIAMGTDQVSMVALPDLQLDAEEDAALRAAIEDLLTPLGLSVTPLAPGRWHLQGDTASLPALRAASPATVARAGVLDWWNHDPAQRPWRRLLNEVQMAWHTHPVNEARSARGLLPVNALWRYGGAQPWPRPAQTSVQVIDALHAAAQTEDWGRWLQQIPVVLTQLADWQARADMNETLVLTGPDRLVALRLAPRPWWQRWRQAPQHEWKHWWQLRA